MSNTMCTVPWVGFSNDPDGRIRPCCISKDHVVKEDGSFDIIHDFLMLWFRH